MPRFRRLSICRHLLVFGLLLAGVVAPASLATAQTQTKAAAKVEKFALLVGITQYSKKRGLEPLTGCLNDVDDMKASLVRNFGFKNDNAHILVLKNAAATRSGIIKAFRTQLSANAKKHPKGVFLFYYSGHGSQTRDINGDEALLDPSDTLDETLVPFDSTRAPKDRQHFDLVDDDIQVLYDELQGAPHFKGSLTSIFDCCYSGTATRSSVSSSASGRRTRSIPADSRLYPKHLGLREKGLTADSRPYLNGKASLASHVGRYAAFSGSMANELSDEQDFTEMVNGKKEVRSHGVLTYYLLQAMNEASRETTNGEIWQRVALALNRYSQSPQLEGVTNQPFLGGSIRSTVLPITYTRTGKTLTIGCGIEGGAIKGGFVELFGTATSGTAKGGAKSGTPSSRSSLGRLQITSSGMMRSQVVLPETFKAPLPAKGVAQLLTPYFGQQPLRVGLGELGATLVAKRLREFTKNNDVVQLASSDEIADVTLATCTYGEAFPHGCPIETKTAPPPANTRGYCFSVRPGAPPLFYAWFQALPTGDISDGDEEFLCKALDNLAAQRNILTLSNASASASKFGPAVKLEAFKVPGQMDGGYFVPTANGMTRLSPDATGAFIVKDQDRVQFRLTNQTNNRVYVSLLWLSQDGGITAVSDAYQRKNIVLKPKGEDGSTASTGIYRNDLSFGSEPLKLLVSSQPINAAVLERDKLERGIQEDGPASPFEMLLGQAMNTRGPISSSNSANFNFRFDGWAVGDFRLIIGPRAKP